MSFFLLLLLLWLWLGLVILGRGVQPFGVSGPYWKKKSCIGPHIKYIVTRNHRKKSHYVLSKFMILFGPHAARRLQVGHPCFRGKELEIQEYITRSFSLSCQQASRIQFSGSIYLCFPKFNGHLKSKESKGQLEYQAITFLYRLHLCPCFLSPMAPAILPHFTRAPTPSVHFRASGLWSWLPLKNETTLAVTSPIDKAPPAALWKETCCTSHLGGGLEKASLALLARISLAAVLSTSVLEKHSASGICACTVFIKSGCYFTNYFCCLPFSPSETPIARIAGHEQLSRSSLMAFVFLATLFLVFHFAMSSSFVFPQTLPHLRGHTCPEIAALCPVICVVNGVCVCANTHVCLYQEFLNPGTPLCSQPVQRKGSPPSTLSWAQTLGFTVNFLKD